MSLGRAESRQVTALQDLQLHFKTLCGKHVELNHKIYWLVLVLPHLLRERTSTQPTHQPLAGETALSKS